MFTFLPACIKLVMSCLSGSVQTERGIDYDGGVPCSLVSMEDVCGLDFLCWTQGLAGHRTENFRLGSIAGGELNGLWLFTSFTISLP